VLIANADLKLQKAYYAKGRSGASALPFAGFALIKVWFWLGLQKNDIVREVKRLEVQVVSLRRSFVVHPDVCNRDAVALLSAIRPEPAVLGEPSLEFLPPRMRLLRRCEAFRPRVSIRFADRDVPTTTDFIDFTANKFTILLEEMEHECARASHESYQSVSGWNGMRKIGECCQAHGSGTTEPSGE